MINVFLDVYRAEYIGSYDISAKRKLVHEIRKIILELHQEKTLPSRQTSIDTPDNLYAMYIHIVAGLLNGACL